MVEAGSGQECMALGLEVRAPCRSSARTLPWCRSAISADRAPWLLPLIRSRAACQRGAPTVAGMSRNSKGWVAVRRIGADRLAHGWSGLNRNTLRLAWPCPARPPLSRGWPRLPAGRSMA